MSPEEPNCYKRKCTWLIGLKPQSMEKDGHLIVFCQAYPDGDGIPQEILYGDDLHEAIREDQIGEFTYEKRKE